MSLRVIFEARENCIEKPSILQTKSLLLKIRTFKEKLNQIAKNGLNDRETCDRYRELMKKQEELRSQVEENKI